MEERDQENELHGYKAPTIVSLLRRKKLKASRVGIAKFLKKYEETGSIARRLGSGRPTKVTAEMKALVDRTMEEDDEATSTQLHSLFMSCGYEISFRTINAPQFLSHRNHGTSSKTTKVSPRVRPQQVRLRWESSIPTLLT